MTREACSLCSLKRHTFGTSCRDSLASTAFKPALLPGNRAYATHARAPENKNRSGESCGSSVVEHSLGKGEAESSILSRSTSGINKLMEYLKMSHMFI
mgnify:CR=1 FL=1